MTGEIGVGDGGIFYLRHLDQITGALFYLKVNSVLTGERSNLPTYWAGCLGMAAFFNVRRATLLMIAVVMVTPLSFMFLKILFTAAS